MEAERAAVECASLMAGLEASAYTTHVACHVAELRCDRDPERCIEELQVAAGLRFDDTDPSLSSSTRLVLIRAAIAAGRVAEADEWATTAAAHAARLRLPILGVRALCGRAEVMLARDEAALAARLAQDALTVAQRIGAPLDAADARLLTGRALAATGDREPRPRRERRPRSARCRRTGCSRSCRWWRGRSPCRRSGRRSDR